MLFVLFQLGRDRYALAATSVVEILPLVQLKALPRAPTGVAGVFNYHGAPVPVVDLSALALGRAATHRLGTRILLTQQTDANGTRRVLGLVAEHATETLRCDPATFVPSGVASNGAPYLGPVKTDPRGLIQWIEPERLLSPAVRDALFKTVEENA